LILDFLGTDSSAQASERRNWKRLICTKESLIACPMLNVRQGRKPTFAASCADVCYADGADVQSVKTLSATRAPK
jgi:hypothetical protein